MGTQIGIRAYLKKANMYSLPRRGDFKEKKRRNTVVFHFCPFKSLFSISKNAEHAADFGHFEAVFHRRT